MKQDYRPDYGSDEPGPEVLEAVRAAAADRSITCTSARKLAGDLSVSPQMVGRAADQLNIKIKNCELGCF